MYGIFIMLLCYVLGLALAKLTGNFIPGSIVGMILFFAALSLKWVRPVAVRKSAGFLLDNMMLFFVPVGVGLMVAYPLLKDNLVAILVVSLVSTVMVIAIVGLTAHHITRRKTDKTGRP